MVGIVAIPWCIKPLFGYLLDQFINKFGKTKYMILASSTWKILAYFLIAFLDLHAVLFYMVFITVTISVIMENIICEYILVL